MRAHDTDLHWSRHAKAKHVLANKEDARVLEKVDGRLGERLLLETDAHVAAQVFEVQLSAGVERTRRCQSRDKKNKKARQTRQFPI